MAASCAAQNTEQQSSGGGPEGAAAARRLALTIQVAHLHRLEGLFREQAAQVGHCGWTGPGKTVE